MPAASLSDSGRRAILRRDDIEAPPSERRYEHRIDAAVAEAQEHGDFASLEGRGRPLGLDDGLAAVEDPQWLVHHLLKNAGYVPPFAALAAQVEALRAASARVEAAWLRAADQPTRTALAGAVEAAWEAENTLVRRWNQEAPSPSLQRYPLPIARRWARLQTRPANAGAG